MKRILMIILLVIPCVVHAQRYIYDHYAHRTDLKVVYYPQFRLDDIHTVNVTILIAKDSAAWEWMQQEFDLPSIIAQEQDTAHSSRRAVQILGEEPRCLQRLTSSASDKHFIVEQYDRRAIFIFHYTQKDQLKALFSFTLNPQIHEKK